ncbi:hypothetical protein NQ317_000710 [Molorchus minor]|uniref:Uncharacterized protein n=1 Tax=Molorchus minor TaxID=1323400 RepID=A0ABQ9J1V5_9CUCU|nr:hypothetical protein NQ317_000710 [Molorchus minor]
MWISMWTKSSLCSEMTAEFRNAMCCQGPTKPIKKKAHRSCNSTGDDGRFHPPGSYTSYGFVSKEPLS